MSIEFDCESCGKHYRVDDSLAGRKGKCKACGGPIVIPLPHVEHEPDNFQAMEALLASEELPFALLHPPSRPLQPQVKIYKPKSTVRLSLTDDVARMISGLLVLAFIGGSIWMSIKVVNMMLARVTLPEDLTNRIYVVAGLDIAWKAFFFFVVATPALLIVCGLACNWTNWALPDSAYTRSAGTMSLPNLMLYLIAMFAMNGEQGMLIAVVVAMPFVMVIGLKELMGLKWSTTAVAVGLLIVVMPIVGLGFAFISKQLAPPFLQMAGLSVESIQQYRKDHPEIVKSNSSGMSSRQNANRPSNSFSSSPRPEPPPATPIQMELNKINTDIYGASIGAEEKTLEALQPLQADFSKRLAAAKPFAERSDWDVVSEKLEEFNRIVAAAPSRKPPAEIFQAIPSTPIAMEKLDPAKLGKDEFALLSILFKPTIDAKVDLASYRGRKFAQEWKFADGSSVALNMVTSVDNSRQQRPWVYDRRSMKEFVDADKLFGILFAGAVKTEGTINGVSWTRLTSKPNQETSPTMYVARVGDRWLTATIKTDGSYIEGASSAEKLIQSIHVAKADEKGADPFELSRVVEKFGEPFVDPGEIIRAAGPEGLKALEAYCDRMGDSTPSEATWLLRSLTRETEAAVDAKHKAELQAGLPIELTGDPSEIPRILADMKATGEKATGDHDKRSAIHKLLNIKPTDEYRDRVAGQLELIVLSKEDSFWYGDEAAKALEIWWRPKTITNLLPAVAKDDFFGPNKNVLRVLAKTKDKKVVYPILRWIIKSPQDVVALMIEMGPMVEDDTCKILSDNNGDARKNAAKILEEVGTRKSLSALSRASKDKRDPAASIAAQNAIDAINLRHPPQATTKPATNPIILKP